MEPASTIRDWNLVLIYNSNSYIYQGTASFFSDKGLLLNTQSQTQSITFIQVT